MSNAGLSLPSAWRIGHSSIRAIPCVGDGDLCGAALDVTLRCPSSRSCSSNLSSPARMADCQHRKAVEVQQGSSLLSLSYLVLDLATPGNAFSKGCSPFSRTIRIPFRQIDDHQPSPVLVLGLTRYHLLVSLYLSLPANAISNPSLLNATEVIAFPCIPHWIRYHPVSPYPY